MAGVSNFMAQPFASASTEASVRSTSGTLNALSCVVRAPASSPAATRLGAARHLALGGLDAPRLVRHAAQRDAAGAVALHDRGDGDQREGVGSAVAHLAIDVRAADRLGQRHRRDQLARLERVLDVRRVPGQAMEVGDRDRARRAVGPHRLDRRVERAHRDRHVARVRRDAGIAHADDGVLPAEAADRARSRCRARACCTAGWCRRSRGSGCAAAGCRPWSPGCAAGRRRRRASARESTP